MRKTMEQKNILTQDRGLNVSEAYKVIQSQDLISALEAKGFKTEQVIKTRVKKAEKQGFQKHMIRMSHEKLAFRNVNDSRPEVVIVNSYDGSTSLQFKLGIFRLICSNGLVVGNNILDYRIRHVGEVTSKIADTLDIVASKLSMVDLQITQMKETKLNLEAQQNIIQAGLEALDFKQDRSIDLKSLLTTRRIEDAEENVWTFYNKIQENLIRFGIRYSTTNEFGRTIFNRTRPVKAIDRQVKINQALYNAALESVR